jgi:hypothetical protein
MPAHLTEDVRASCAVLYPHAFAETTEHEREDVTQEIYHDDVLELNLWKQNMLLAINTHPPEAGSADSVESLRKYFLETIMHDFEVNIAQKLTKKMQRVLSSIINKYLETWRKMKILSMAYRESMVVYYY